MYVRYDNLCLSKVEEIEEDVFNIPLKNGGDLCVSLDEEQVNMFFVPPDLWELLSAGYSDDEAAPIVEMEQEDEAHMIDYLMKASYQS